MKSKDSSPKTKNYNDDNLLENNYFLLLLFRIKFDYSFISIASSGEGSFLLYFVALFFSQTHTNKSKVFQEIG